MTERINQTAFDKLRKGFTGKILLPDDPSYEQSRSIFNAMIIRHPSAIAQCAIEEDVVHAVNFCRDLDLEISIRSGGHSAAGWGLTEGGLMIDLSLMNKVEVDPDNLTARVGGGATWNDLDHACHRYGLATTGGICTTTGVAGVTLSGGWGWLARKYGLGCDNLLTVKLVTADGEVVVASEKNHSELFWALHGGGGNFGIATEFTFQLHPLPSVTAAYLVFSPDAGSQVINRFRDVIEEGPDELSGEVVYITGPPEDFVPSHLVNQLCLMVTLFYAGPEAEANMVIKPMLEAGPEGKIIAEMSYFDIQTMGEIESGHRHHVSSEHLTALPKEAIDKFCDRAHDMIIPSASELAISAWGGQITRRTGDWPIANHDANWLIYPFAMWTNPDKDKQVFDWIKGVNTDLAPYATGCPYLNLITDEGKERMIAGYGGEAKYQRLVKIKKEYDPDNIFHLNHNIKP